MYEVCGLCGGPVEGWYQQRWKTAGYSYPVCRHCWRETMAIEGHHPDGPGVKYQEESSPAFHIIRRRMVEDWRK